MPLLTDCSGITTETQNALGADRKDTPLRYMPLVAQYTFSRFGETGEFAGNLGLVVNTGYNSRDVDCQGVQMEQFACRRAYARPGFAVVRGDMTYSKRLLAELPATEPLTAE